MAALPSVLFFTVFTCLQTFCVAVVVSLMDWHFPMKGMEYEEAQDLNTAVVVIFLVGKVSSPLHVFFEDPPSLHKSLVSPSLNFEIHR